MLTPQNRIQEMKKTFSILAGGLALAFAFQSCQQKVDMTAINAKVDSIANIKIEEYKTQLMNECSAKVKSAAVAKADSIIAAAASKGGKKPATKPSTPPPPPPKEEKKDGGKMIDNNNQGKIIEKANQQGGKLIDKMGGKK